MTTNATSATRAVETEAVSRRPLVERDRHPLTALWLAVALGALAAAPSLLWYRWYRLHRSTQRKSVMSGAT